MADSNPLSMPPALAARRDALLETLDEKVATAKGPAQQMLRFTAMFIRALEPQGDLVQHLSNQFRFHNDMAAVVNSVSKGADGNLKPFQELLPVIRECQAFCVDAAGWMKEWAGKSGVDAAVAAKAAEVVSTAATAMGKLADGFEGGPKRRATGEFLGNVDAAPAGTATEDKRRQPEDLKKWVNPGLGKIPVR